MHLASHDAWFILVELSDVKHAVGLSLVPDVSPSWHFVIATSETNKTPRRTNVWCETKLGYILG